MRLNFLIVVLVSALIFLQYRLWFETGGMQELLNLKKKLAFQIEENKKLSLRNQEMLFQIQRLQNSHEANEARARNELGMIKKGETFYQIVK